MDGFVLQYKKKLYCDKGCRVLQYMEVKQIVLQLREQH